MTITITKEIQAAYDAYLAEQIDSYFDGRPILRSDTYPYNESRAAGMVDFAAGYQVGAAPSDRAAVDDPVAADGDCGNAECGWHGPLSECSYLGAVGPCCPRCREIVEPDALTTQAPAEPTPTISRELAEKMKADYKTLTDAKVKKWMRLDAGRAEDEKAIAISGYALLCQILDSMLAAPTPVEPGNPANQAEPVAWRVKASQEGCPHDPRWYFAEDRRLLAYMGEPEPLYAHPAGAQGGVFLIRLKDRHAAAALSAYARSAEEFGEDERAEEVRTLASQAAMHPNKKQPD